MESLANSAPTVHPIAQNRSGGINSFVLKVLAILGMTANHAAHLLGQYFPLEVTFALYCFGGMTYPTMAFLMVEGYLHTSNLRKYALRIGVFASISQVPFSLAFGARANVLVTLLMGLFLLWAWDFLKNKGGSWRWLFLPILAAVTAISQFCDWEYVGPAMVWLFYVLRQKRVFGVLVTMIAPYAYMIGRGLFSLVPAIPEALSNASIILERGLQESYRVLYVAGVPIHLTNPIFSGAVSIGYAVVGFTIATICICHYNGKRGRPMKWFFYAFYPVHLFVLWGISQLLAL